MGCNKNERSCGVNIISDMLLEDIDSLGGSSLCEILTLPRGVLTSEGRNTLSIFKRDAVNWNGKHPARVQSWLPTGSQAEFTAWVTALPDQKRSHTFDLYS